MTALHQQHCEACRADAPLVTEAQARELLRNIPAWKNNVMRGVEKLVGEFEFAGFREAFAFSAKVAELAEQENHHPSIITEWGRVRVYWWTHKINGLHLNDFIMAAKTGRLAGRS